MRTSLGLAFLITLISAVSYAKTWTQIMAKGSVEVCVPGSVLSIKSFLSKLAESFAQNYKLKANIIHIEWNEQFFDRNKKIRKDESYDPMVLKSGKCDILASPITINSWRKKLMTLVPFVPNRIIVLANKKTEKTIRKMADLAGKTTGTPFGTTYYEWIMEQNKQLFQKNPIKIEEIPVRDGLSKVDKGSLDFALFDYFSAMLFIKDGFDNTQARFTVGTNEQLAWGIKKGNKKLRDKILAFFESETKDDKSELNKIWKQYIGMPYSQYIKAIGYM